MAAIREIEIVSQAEDVDEAMQAFQQDTPDVVVLDLQLREGSGLDLIPAIKKTSTATKVIIFTNYPDSLYRKRSKELGADFYFDKSIEFEAMMVVISQLVSTRDWNRPIL